MSTIILSDHDSFVDFFRKFAEGEITDKTKIQFELPRAQKETPFLRVTGDDYDGTINALVMEALLTYQKNINRLYSLAVYGKVKRLKAEEAEAIRIIFQVRGGSSNFHGINTQKTLELILSKLSSEQITFIAVVWLLLHYSSQGLIHYLDKEYEYKNRQIDSEQTQIEQQVLPEQSEIDKELILNTISKIEGGDRFLDDNKKFLNRLKQLSKHAKTVKYSGHTISSTARRTKKKKKVFSTDQLNGKYRILQLTAQPDGCFKVKIKNSDMGNTCNAKLDDAISQKPKLLEIVNQAFFDRKELYLNIERHFADDDLVDVLVTSIKELKDTE